MRTFKNFLTDESGATAIEYGLIAALIAVALIASAQLLGEELEDTFEKITTELSKANGGSS